MVRIHGRVRIIGQAGGGRRGVGCYLLDDLDDLLDDLLDGNLLDDLAGPL